TPGTERRRLPVVFLKADIMRAQVDADGGETPQVDVLDVGWRRFKNYLKLRVLVKAIGIFAVATVGGPTAGLHIRNAVGRGSEDAEKRFRVHGASTDFDIVRLLQDATLLHPEMRERQNQILEVQPTGLMFKFYFNFQVVSKNSRVR